MKKSIKYSSVIAAALLSVAPIVTNSVAMAAEEKPAVAKQADSKQTPVVKQDDKTKLGQPGDSIDNPIKLTSSVDKKDVRVKVKDGLTMEKVANYLHPWIHVFADGKEFETYSRGLNYSTNKNANFDYAKRAKKNPTEVQLIKGNIFSTYSPVHARLKPSTWYTWDQSENPIFYLDNEVPDEFKDRLSVKKIGENQYKVTERTDDKGEFIAIRLKKGSKDYLTQILAIEYPSEEINVTVFDPSEKDALDIPITETKPKNDSPKKDTDKPNTPSNKTEDKKDADVSTPTETQTPVDTNTTIDSTPVTTPSASSVPETSNNTQVTPDTNKDVKANDNASTAQKPVTSSQSKTTKKTTKETKSTSKKHKSSKKLMFTHNAYVYNKKGKLFKTKNHAFILLRKNKYFNALDNGKVYTINKKKYYRIGKNKYIKVANTGKRPAAKTIKKNAKLKGKRRAHVYNSDGKITKSYAPKKMKLDRVRTMNGKKFYRIANTNHWVNARKVSLKK